MASYCLQEFEFLSDFLDANSDKTPLPVTMVNEIGFFGVSVQKGK